MPVFFWELLTFATMIFNDMMKRTVYRSLLLLLMLVNAVAVRGQTMQQWRDSLSVLSRLITQSPQSTDLRLRKAAVNIELDQWEYAVEEYGRVLELDARSLPALYYRAYAHNHLRRYDAARADYERFLSLMPRHFEARFGLAMVLRNLGRRTEVLDELNRLVEQFPDSALAFAARADYEAEQGQLELALYDWDEALRLAPANTEFLSARQRVADAMKNGRRGRKKQQ